MTGTLFNYEGMIKVILDGYTPISGDSFDLMSFGSYDNGDGFEFVFNFTQAELSAGLEWDTSSFTTTGSIGVVGVPEPGMFVLLTMAALALSAYACQRRKRSF